MELNDGCSSQFKWITSVSTFARSNDTSTSVYFETSYSKSESDELESFVKSHKSRDVSKELSNYCEKFLTLPDDQNKIYD